MSKIKCATIGLGMGKSHIKGFQSRENAEVVAICDLNEELLKSVGDQFGISNQYTDVTAMLETEKPDVVSIATPNSLHKPLTIQALEAGAHVICEKPMAMNADEAREMQAVADRLGKRLMINFSYRFTEAAWGLKQQVERGLLGEIYSGRTRWLRRWGMPKFGSWFGRKALSGGGPLIDLGVHRLDLAMWLSGYPKPKYVLAQTYDHLAQERARAEGVEFDVEDLASAMITFENGMSLQVEASWASHIQENEQMETTLLGTRGGLRQRNLDGGYAFQGHIFSSDQGSKLDTEVVGGNSPGSSMGHLIDCIERDQPHTASGEEGIVIMEVLDAIYASAAKGGEPVKC
ncbi:MAG: Gfo/Idh/MocA family oxidoreductase [Opitutales bacterium]|nr:Gfo/Idh/MocA family oxidoreductase [Opitutales bacterium]